MKHSMVKPLNIWPSLPGQEIPVADADGDELVVVELDTGDELGETVTMDTTVVVALGDELGDTVKVETTVVVATVETTVVVDDTTVVVDETTVVVDAGGATVVVDAGGTTVVVDAGDTTVVVPAWETTVVVATGAGLEDAKGVEEVVGQELMVCLKELVTNTVEVAVLVRVVVAEAEVTVEVAAGWTAAVAVLVLVEVTETVLVAAVEAAGDVLKVAVNSRGVCASALNAT
jgi:hypothetical protein